MKRIKRTSQGKGDSSIFAVSQPLDFVGTGCMTLDQVLGSGWPLGRISNIVGDKSTGKTLLAIEAAANFVKQYPKGRIWYAEAESAFDKSYAASLGMPIDKVKFSNPDTVEDFQEELTRITKNMRDKGKQGLYILDSLDALSDRKEMARDVDERTYGGDKAKQMSQLFRKLVRPVERANIAVIIISQVRDKIGISFGRKTSRTGGKALDFYASLVVYLLHMKNLVKTRKKIKRVVGVRIRANCDKNKITQPQRQCEFQIRFGFGVNSAAAGLSWIIEHDKIDLLNLTKRQAKDLLTDLEALDDIDIYLEWNSKIRKKLKRAWNEVETTFLPKFKKYAD